MKKRNLGLDVVKFWRRAILPLILSTVVLRGYSQTPPLVAPPEVSSHHHVAALTLHAVRGSDGRDGFLLMDRRNRRSSVFPPGTL